MSSIKELADNLIAVKNELASLGYPGVPDDIKERLLMLNLLHQKGEIEARLTQRGVWL